MKIQHNTTTRFEEVEALIAERQSLPTRIREAALACDADRLAKLEADRRLAGIPFWSFPTHVGVNRR